MSKVMIEFSDEAEVQALFDFLHKEKVMIRVGFELDSQNNFKEPLDSPGFKRLAEIDEWLDKLEAGIRRERRNKKGQYVFEFFEIRRK